MAKDKVPFGSALEDSSKAGDAADRMESQKANAAPPAASAPAGGVPADPSAPQQEVTSPRIKEPEPDWLAMSRSCLEDSTTWLDSSLRAQWEKNMRAFQSQHPPGSKYLSDAYKARSKLFRPKTRSSIRQGEAAAATAFFRNEDVINVAPIDQENPKSLASASIVKELLQYRLTTQNPRRGIPWYKTLIGAYQDAQVNGVVASKQWWEFSETQDFYGAFEGDRPVMDEATGQQKGEFRKRTLIDRPRIDLIPPEQLRIDRGADWLDPITTSPFVQVLNPLYAGTVAARANKTGRDGTTWMDFSISDLAKSQGHSAWDSTRLQRNKERTDPKDSEISIPEYRICWVIENFMEWRGEKFVFWTAWHDLLLSKPVPVNEIYRHCEDGELPIVMGQALVETHKIYPSGKPQLTNELQKEANEVVNLRLDNVKLALNKRYLVRRGRQVDLRQLTRSSPGSGILVTDKDDVIPMETRDVTQSSFAEQDRINSDFDDVSGNFSPGSVNTNRKLNETVGGMELLQGSANMIGEFDLRTFAETWTEPCLRQVARLEQIYESDLAVLAIAGQKAKLIERYGVNEINDEMLMADMSIRVNVGLGATDPMKVLEKLKTGAEITGMILGKSVQGRVNGDEFIKEIWGALGYRDGKRFFKAGPDPMILQLQEQLAELQKEVDRQTISARSRETVAKITAFGEILEELVKQEGASRQAQQQTQIEDKRAEADRGFQQKQMGEDRAFQEKQTMATQAHDMRKTTMGHAVAAEAQKNDAISRLKEALLSIAPKMQPEAPEDPNAPGPAQPAQPGIPGGPANPVAPPA